MSNNVEPRPKQGMKFLSTLLLSLLTLSVAAQLPSRLPVSLKWDAAPTQIHDEEGRVVQQHLSFAGADYVGESVALPVYVDAYELPGYGTLSVEISNANVETVDADFMAGVELPETFGVNAEVQQARRDFVGKIELLPLRRTNGQVERLTDFTLVFRFQGAPAPTTASLRGPITSVLASGDFFKISVQESGVYRLDRGFLSDLGLDVDNLDPRNLKIYGNGGGNVPRSNDAPRPEDLVENAIVVTGEADGDFNDGDAVLFYAEGPSRWEVNASGNDLAWNQNVYDTENYYFITVAGGAGKRIIEEEGTGSAGAVYNAYTDFQRYEYEKFNLLQEVIFGQGSGQEFYGDVFRGQTLRTYDEFNFPDRVKSEPVRVKARMAMRSRTSSTRFAVTVEGQEAVSPAVSSCGSSALSCVARTETIVATFPSTADNPSIDLEYRRFSDGSAEAWLDYLQVDAKRSKLPNAQQEFTFMGATTDGNALMKIGKPSGVEVTIWDITDPTTVHREALGDDGGFTDPAFPIRRYVSFTGNDFKTPEAVGKVENQNLHALNGVELLIIHHADFREQAERLAQHRRDWSGMSVANVDVEQVYNEFSSGRQDAGAIRDLARLLYERDGQLKYVLLFGDASFDPRDIYGHGNHFVPTYQTEFSLSEINAYPADDFYALLSPGEGTASLTGALDIAVGRLPAQSEREATIFVDKIIRYDTQIDTYGDWRNRIMFVGDDEDNGIHTRDVDSVARQVEILNPNVNAQKVYLDAFQQVSTPGGTRIPSATENLNNNIFKGVLSVIYLGHGGPKGWTQERVLKIPDILSWRNPDRLPLFITATCTFAGFDDPLVKTGGEEVISSESGGAIALFSTVRPVQTSGNRLLTLASAQELYDPVNRDLTMGQVLAEAKNNSGAPNSNSRKFFLLGDPSQELALPKYRVVGESVNGNPLGAQPDTIRALQKVTITGRVEDFSGNLLDDFNGVLAPTIFDKATIYQTLQQDPGSPLINFKLRNNVIFKGNASVTNGRFEFTFVVPKDINFAFGEAKLSFYAEDDAMTRRIDAAGASFDLVVGGTDPNALADDEGPQVDVFMNTEDFVFGGLTGDDPVLLVKLRDDFGINVAGTSIGHDLTGTLDENTQNTYRLNDFYEAELDDYTRGTVRFPLSDLAEGRHQISVRAWDVANNPGTGYTEFIVAADGKIALDRVLNYPNPFTTSTCFQFEHGMDVGDLDVRVQIFTINGKLVKTLEQRINTPGSRLGLDNCVEWDARDDFGDELARGVYLYRIQVRTADGAALEGESDFEKLVILK